jgi:hypothetical protein
VDKHVGAVLGAGLRAAPADAARSAGDESCLSFEAGHGETPDGWK